MKFKGVPLLILFSFMACSVTATVNQTESVQASSEDIHNQEPQCIYDAVLPNFENSLNQHITIAITNHEILDESGELGATRKITYDWHNGISEYEEEYIPKCRSGSPCGAWIKVQRCDQCDIWSRKSQQCIRICRPGCSKSR